MEAAIRYFQAASGIDPGLNLRTLDVGAAEWNSLCWNGAVEGFAAEVIHACDLAIEVASPNRKDYYRDSRGVARARTDDLEGAVEDLETFIAWAEGEHPGDDLIAKRRNWVTALRQGNDPFDAPTVESLRSESF
jgi:hypothetical protein